MKNIFLHGWGFSKEIWEEFFDLKNSTFLDLPFHGESKFNGKNEILKKFSEEIYRKIENEKEPVNLIGWSLGATVSILVALKKPENLQKMVLVGFSPKFKDENSGHSPIAVKAFMISLKKDFEKTVINFRKTAAGKVFENIPLPEKIGSTALLKEFIDLDLTEVLKDIDIETIFIHGKNDKITNYKGSVFSAEKVKNSKLVLTDGNHAPFLEDKKLILEYLV